MSDENPGRTDHQPRPGGSETGHDDHRGDESDRAVLSQPVEAKNRGDEPDQGEHNAKDGAGSAAQWQKASVVINGVIALAAVLVLFYTVWDGSRRTADRDAQMIVIQESLTEARNANTAIAGQFRLAERPWLTRGSIVMHDSRGNEIDTFSVNAPGRVRMTLENTGRSPALNVKGYGCVMRRPSQDDPTRDECPAALPSDYGIGVGGLFALESDPIAYTVEQLVGLAGGTDQIWFFWGATYDDQFGNSHESHLCSQWSSRNPAIVGCPPGKSTLR